MSRTDYLTIGIVAVCLVALFYLIYQFANLGQTEKPLPETQEAPVDNYPATDDLYNPEATDTSFTNEEPYPDESYPEPETSSAAGQKETEQPDAGSSTAKPAPATPKPAPPKPQPVPSTTTESTAVSYGNYLVLAGSFKYKANAETEVRKLRKMGYSNAEVAMFNRGAYASALVDRFDNYADANALVKELKGKGVEALVQKKRPQ